FARGGKLNTKALAAKGDHLKAIARHVEAGEKRALAEQKFQQAMMPPGPQGGQMGMPGAGGMPQGPGAPAPMLSFMGHATGGFAGSGQTLLDIRKQNSQVLPEPAVIMGAQTGRIYGTAAENGPERETNTGTGFRFSPLPGVSRQTTPQAQQQIVGEAETRMPPKQWVPGAPGNGGAIGQPTVPPEWPPRQLPKGQWAPGAPGNGGAIGQPTVPPGWPTVPIGGAPQPAWDPMNPATTTLNPNAPPATALEYAQHIGRIRSGQGNIFDYAWLAQHGFSRTMLDEAAGRYSGPGSMAPPGPTGTQQPVGQMAPPQLSFGPVAAHAGGGYMAFAGGGDLASQLRQIAASPNRQYLQDNAAAINAGTMPAQPQGDLASQLRQIAASPDRQWLQDNAAAINAGTNPLLSDAAEVDRQAQAVEKLDPNASFNPSAYGSRWGAYGQPETNAQAAARMRHVALNDRFRADPSGYGTGWQNGRQVTTGGKYLTPEDKEWFQRLYRGGGASDVHGNISGTATSSATATPQDMNNAVNTYIANQLKLQGTNPVLRPGQTLYDPRYLAPIWDKLKSG
ncbi:MAG: hypothetical protein KGI06_06270, partial [Candidatus Micrarchaeota archaeon]|nr:hypothetical protein [Candidatus Micrarchaeota archaeon]